MKSLLVKVCSINREKNLFKISQLDVDMIGLNFYLDSKRYINNISININSNINRVGVFVDPTEAELNQYISDAKLDYLQLHGSESPEFCKAMSSKCSIIKAFGVDADFDFSMTSDYEFVDYFLFDTKTILHGGSGKKFNWQKLKEYKGETPFLLAGGIGPEDADKLLEIDHPKFAGVDINSRFEIEPGIKHVGNVDEFIKRLKN